MTRYDWVDVLKTAAPIVGSLLLGIAGTTAYHATNDAQQAKAQPVNLHVECKVPEPKPIHVEIVK